MAKKTTSAGSARGSASSRARTPERQPTTGRRPKKHVGDVLGISRAQVPDDVPRATKDRGGRPKGIELGAGSRPRLKRAGVVGGVRGRGR